MLYEFVAEATGAESNGSGRWLPPFDAAGLSHLEAVLRKDCAAEGAALRVAVTEGCGAVEVRVSGAKAALRLSFDRAELHPPYVRQVVRNAVTRYRFSLGGQLMPYSGRGCSHDV